MAEHAFYHPDVGVWIAISDVPQGVRDGYPAGTVEIPMPPGAGYEWDGAAWVEAQQPPPPVPQTVSRFQARAAMMMSPSRTAPEDATRTLLDDVQEVVDASEDPMVKLAWAEAIEWRRAGPTINSLADHPSLMLTQAELDDFFRAAAGIEA